MVLEKDTAVLLLAWYDFPVSSAILCIEENNEAFSSSLKKRGLAADSATIRTSARASFVDANLDKYDYIVAAGSLERCRMPGIVLRQWSRLLKEDGSLLLADQNRLGIQFFCGDRDPFTHNVFDGIENYPRTPSPWYKYAEGKLYARSELESLLEQAGFFRRKFYSVYPSLLVPQLLYAEGCLPNEDLSQRIVPRYYDKSGVFMDERCLYETLVKNGMFHQMANAYFIECPKKKDFSAVRHVTLPVFRNEEAFATIIHESGTVEKRILDSSGQGKLQKMQENAADLNAHGIKTVCMEIRGSSLFMPYIEAPLAVCYLRGLLNQDTDRFIAEMDRFRELILQSSDHVPSPEDDIILRRGYMDLVPINAFYLDGEFVFFDQEFCCENLPAKVIIWRTVLFIYDAYPRYEAVIPMKFFLERYEIPDDGVLFRDYVSPFMKELLNRDVFAEFNGNTEQSVGIIQQNYRIINSGLVDEGSLLSTCFDHLDGKKVFIFGAGKYADKFLAFYKDEYDIEAVLDSSSEKQGGYIRGVKIVSPEVLRDFDPADYKVILCARKYTDMVSRARMLGARNIGLYFAGCIYSGRQVLVPLLKANQKPSSQKKYCIGYIAGVFDLYHLGHLNMFRRAKELCDYLIVGVTSDRYVRELKKKEPFIPFEERLEMVRSCRYVDEAHEIPFEYGGTVEAFQKYHFDVQFSGSDYINHPWWLEQQKWLREHGADLVFFPYTQQTSSTKIKALIEKGLL